MLMSAQEIGSLVLDIATFGDRTLRLDQILNGVCEILSARPELGIQCRSILLRFDQRDGLKEIARYDLTAINEVEINWNSVRFPSIPVSCRIKCVIGDFIALPLIIENNHFGYLLIYRLDGLEESKLDVSTLDLLAAAISERFRRFMLDQTIELRDWELEDTRFESIHRLGATAEFRDNETGWHVMRMANYALAIAKYSNISDKERELIYLTAPMHDIGKVGVPDAILFKPATLTEDEIAVMRLHPSFGESIFAGDDDVSEMARIIAGYHHERWDGSGYPRGLQGKDIPIAARICAIADVFDALTTVRPYKEAWTFESASSWIISQSGILFDPEQVEGFQEALPEIARIRDLYRDVTINPRQVMALPPRHHPAKEWFVWDGSLAIGIDAIDDQHRYLFDLVNELHEVVVNFGGARSAIRVIKELEQYADVHFAAEEKMMAQVNYSKIESHKRLHQQFRDKMHRARESMRVDPLHDANDILEFLVEWLVDHIGREDMKIKDFIVNNNNAEVISLKLLTASE